MPAALQITNHMHSSYKHTRPFRSRNKRFVKETEKRVQVHYEVAALKTTIFALFGSYCTYFNTYSIFYSEVKGRVCGELVLTSVIVFAQFSVQTEQK